MSLKLSVSLRCDFGLIKIVYCTSLKQCSLIQVIFMLLLQSVPGSRMDYKSSTEVILKQTDTALGSSLFVYYIVLPQCSFSFLRRGARHVLRGTIYRKGKVATSKLHKARGS